MRVLELYSGNKWGENVFKEFGIKAISIRMDMFDYSLYPRDGFDMVFININGIFFFFLFRICRFAFVYGFCWIQSNTSW